MGISGTRGDLRKDVENGDLGRERGDLLEFCHQPVLAMGHRKAVEVVD